MHTLQAPQVGATARLRWWSVMMAIGLCLALVASLMQQPGGVGTGSALRVQPYLLDMARRTPDVRVSTIIQTAGQPEVVRAAVARLGGEVTSSIDMIRALVVTLPARAVLELGRLPDVRWISYDAPMTSSSCGACVDVSRLQAAYIKTIGADRVWNELGYTGKGIGVAVLDSGINDQADLYTIDGRNRIVAAVYFNQGYNQNPYDQYGHGNHVAGIIGGNGRQSRGAYLGVAPDVNLINVKVLDEQGYTSMARVLDGLQWIYNNHQRYNIRVVNLSLNSGIPESYHVNPVNAALELLWFHKIVVVVSAGNRAGEALASPANDPFVITVGATDDRGTTSLSDDTLAPFSAYGVSSDGVAKPDLVAPGTNIVSSIGIAGTELQRKYPSHIVNDLYFRMSGTSMSAPMVAGTVALLLQKEPHLTPDQVKYRLLSTARRFDSAQRTGAGYLDAYAALTAATTASANTGQTVSQLLWPDNQAVTWTSSQWSTVQWYRGLWNSSQWSTVQWYRGLEYSADVQWYRGLMTEARPWASNADYWQP